MMSKEMKTLTFLSAFPRSPKFTLGDLDAFQAETDDLARWQKRRLCFWSRSREGSREELVSESIVKNQAVFEGGGEKKKK